MSKVKVIVCGCRMGEHPAVRGQQHGVFDYYAGNRGVIAVRDGRVIGFWAAHRHNAASVDSVYTWVSPSYRRQATARRLWLAGLRAWTPTIITAVAASVDGGKFLATMLPVCLRRGINLRVLARGSSDETFDGAIYRMALQRVCRPR